MVAFRDGTSGANCPEQAASVSRAWGGAFEFLKQLMEVAWERFLQYLRVDAREITGPPRAGRGRQLFVLQSG